MKGRNFVSIAFLLATPAFAQVAKVPNWFQIGSEGDTIVVPQAATLQVCADDTHCTAMILIPAGTTIKVDWSTNQPDPVFGADPESGVKKNVGIIQTCSAQSVSVNGVTTNIQPLSSGCVVTPSTPKVTNTFNSAAYVISTSGQSSLSNTELDAYRALVLQVAYYKEQLALAQQILATNQQTLMQAHGCTDTTKPCTLTIDNSLQTDYNPNGAANATTPTATTSTSTAH